MRQKTLALPVRLVNFSDTSQVLTLFTRDFGLVEAIAKGAHREKNAFQGPFDLAVLWEVVFAERSAERGLSILTEGVVVEGFRGLRRSWARWSAAAFVLEYLRAVGTQGEPAADLFDLSVSALARLAEVPAAEAVGPAPREAAAIEWVLAAFEARALACLGLLAPATSCAGCGRPWSRSDQPVFYSAEKGGILCARCRTRRSPAQGVLVTGKAVRTLEELAAIPAPAPVLHARADAGPAPPTPDPALLRSLRRLLDELRVFLLERDFRLLKYRISLKAEPTA